MWLRLITHRLVELQHLKCKVIWFELPLTLTIQVSVWLLMFSILAWSQPQATSQTRQSVGTTDPAIRSDYLGRTKCLCWWRACSKIWECRNQCGSSGPWSIDHDSLRIDNPCLVWLCAWIGRNEPPVNAFCTIFLVIPVSRPPFLCLHIDTVTAMIYNHTVKSFEFAAQALNSKQHWRKQLFFCY